ncbi:unnamed protein product [Amaranthus hypochondriacus]
MDNLSISSSKKLSLSPSSSSSFHPFSHFHQALTTCSSFLHNFSSSFTNHLNTHLPNFASTFSNSLNSPPFARIPPLTPQKLKQQNCAMSNQAIEERLAGVLVYGLVNSNEEFVLISGRRSKKSFGMFCMKKEDADSLLEQMRLMDPEMRRGSSVVPVALNKVFQLRVKEVSFRLIPEVSEVKNALQEKEKAGFPDEDFPGVPVFQSRSLILSSDRKRYRPVFFRKEDLEKSLFRASKQQGKLNPILRQGDIVVASLEDIIKGMKDDSSGNWDDVVFIPPGFDVSTDPSKLK